MRRGRGRLGAAGTEHAAPTSCVQPVQKHSSSQVDLTTSGTVAARNEMLVVIGKAGRSAWADKLVAYDPNSGLRQSLSKTSLRLLCRPCCRPSSSVRSFRPGRRLRALHIDVPEILDVAGCQRWPATARSAWHTMGNVSACWSTGSRTRRPRKGTCVHHPAATLPQPRSPAADGSPRAWARLSTRRPVSGQSKPPRGVRNASTKPSDPDPEACFEGKPVRNRRPRPADRSRRVRRIDRRAPDRLGLNRRAGRTRSTRGRMAQDAAADSVIGVDLHDQG